MFSCRPLQSMYINYTLDHVVGFLQFFTAFDCQSYNEHPQPGNALVTICFSCFMICFLKQWYIDLKHLNNNTHYLVLIDQLFCISQFNIPDIYHGNTRFNTGSNTQFISILSTCKMLTWNDHDQK